MEELTTHFSRSSFKHYYQLKTIDAEAGTEVVKVELNHKAKNSDKPLAQTVEQTVTGRVIECEGELEFRPRILTQTLNLKGHSESVDSFLKRYAWRKSVRKQNSQRQEALVPTISRAFGTFGVIEPVEPAGKIPFLSKRPKVKSVAQLMRPTLRQRITAVTGKPFGKLEQCSRFYLGFAVAAWSMLLYYI